VGQAESGLPRGGLLGLAPGFVKRRDILADHSQGLLAARGDVKVGQGLVFDFGTSLSLTVQKSSPPEAGRTAGSSAQKMAKSVWAVRSSSLSTMTKFANSSLPPAAGTDTGPSWVSIKASGISNSMM